MNSLSRSDRRFRLPKFDFTGDAMRPTSISSCDAPGGRQKGAAAVEFALVIGVLLLIVGGIVEYGRLFWHYDALTKATRDGARMMSNAVGGTLLSPTAGQASQVVFDEAAGARLNPPLTPAQVVIQCTYLSGGAEGAWEGCHNAASKTDVPVHVRVSITGYTVPLAQWFPIPGANIALRPQTTMRYTYNN